MVLLFVAVADALDLLSFVFVLLFVLVLLLLFVGFAVMTGLTVLVLLFELLIVGPDEGGGAGAGAGGAGCAAGGAYGSIGAAGGAPCASAEYGIKVAHIARPTPSTEPRPSLIPTEPMKSSFATHIYGRPLKTDGCLFSSGTPQQVFSFRAVAYPIRAL